MNLQGTFAFHCNDLALPPQSASDRTLETRPGEIPQKTFKSNLKPFARAFFALFLVHFVTTKCKLEFKVVLCLLF